MREPQLSFHNAALKIEWASQLIQGLQQAIADVDRSDAFAIGFEPSQDGNQHALRIIPKQPLTLTIPCLAGDICGNLRSALDVCWMGVVRSRSESAEKREYFPIAAQKSELEGRLKIFDAETRNIMSHLLVEKIKPRYDCNEPMARSICELHMQNNLQKHNSLMIIYRVARFGENTVVETDDGSRITMGGAWVGDNSIAIGGGNPRISWDTPPTLEINLRYLRARRDSPLIDALTEFRDAIKSAHQAFLDAFQVAPQS